MSSHAQGRRSAAGAVPFREALRYWLRLGFINFGGPSGQIALMHRDLVDQRRWISESRFLHALNYCMLLPGPEAQQLATYIGWLLHGTWGGIVAGALFVLPSVFILLVLSWVYAAYGDVAWVAALFYGVKPAVVAVVAEAVVRIGRRALKGALHMAIAAFAFAALYFFSVPFPVLILATVVFGFGVAWLAPRWFRAPGGEGEEKPEDEDAVISAHTPVAARPTWGRSLGVIAVCVVLWFAPVAAVYAWRGGDDVLFTEGVFFSKTAMVTFGGAYAVLSYIAQMAVEEFQWIAPGQMLDGLGLAESTPGPLIMVTQFVGFLGAWNHAGDLPPIVAGTLGALITTWVTFLPCFLWIFLGAPFIEQLRDSRRATAAMSVVTAAVVGVILNLAVYFARHVLLPEGRLDAFATVLAVAALGVLLRWKSAMIPVLGAGALLGAAWKLFGS
ncbi:MAG TPA: chromate efflux transporter [Candidatus Acidoferrales bacterium]